MAEFANFFNYGIVLVILTMKRFAGFYALIAIVTLLFIPTRIFAETDITVQSTTGDNTICQNGVCTSTSGSSNSHATGCINGHCETSDTGNLHMHEGDTSSNDQSNTPEISITVSPTLTETPIPTDTPVPTVSEAPSITPNPTITKMRNDINKHVEKEIDGIKEHVKHQNAAISGFVKNEMDALQNLLNGLFK